MAVKAGVCVCVCRHTSVFEGYVIVLDPTAGCSLWLEVLVERAAEEPRCLQPRLWKHKYNTVKPMRSLHWVPLTTSSVETSTPLQRAGFFASKSFTAMLKVPLQRAPTYNNKQFLLHLFTRCKRDPVCIEGSFGHASGYCPFILDVKVWLLTTYRYSAYVQRMVHSGAGTSRGSGSFLLQSDPREPWDPTIEEDQHCWKQLEWRILSGAVTDAMNVKIP